MVTVPVGKHTTCSHYYFRALGLPSLEEDEAHSVLETARHLKKVDMAKRTNRYRDYALTFPHSDWSTAER